MSLGSPRVTVRLPQELIDLVELQIASRNAFSPGEEWDLSAFIKVALREKLAKMARCRAKKPRVGARPGRPGQGRDEAREQASVLPGPCEVQTVQSNIG